MKVYEDKKTLLNKFYKNLTSVLSYYFCFNIVIDENNEKRINIYETIATISYVVNDLPIDRTSNVSSFSTLLSIELDIYSNRDYTSIYNIEQLQLIMKHDKFTL